jgi:hypothetical protein
VADNNGITYTIQEGDTLSSIAKKFDIEDWQIIYSHDANKRYCSANPDYGKIKPGDKLFIPQDHTAMMISGLPYVAIMPGNAIFFDTHMHIQSNNCAPLPIQWGVIKRNAFIRLMASRGLLTLTAAIATNRFGQIGAYSSDKIAIIYTGTGHKAPSKGFLRTMFDFTMVGVAVNSALSAADYINKLLQTDKGMELLTQGGDNTFEVDFKEATKYYFKNNNIERIATCLLMDMSYSHYWGNYGLPITLPLADSNVFINDFISAGRVLSDTSIETDFTSLTEEPVFKLTYPDWSHLFAKFLRGDTFSFKQQFNNFFQTQISNPGTSGVPQADSFFSFSRDPKIHDLDSQLIGKEFVHIIQDLPKSETRLFEDYKKQKLRSIKAAMTFPLKMLPFFHYDPRRHFDKAKRNDLLNELTDHHAFYRISKNKPYLKLTPDEKLNSQSYLETVINSLSDNDSAFKELFPYPSSTSGVFWGVKMYPRLGFAPNNFKLFPQLQGLYSACVANKIPVTAHCSRGPMNIADYFNYSRYSTSPNAPTAFSGNPINYLETEYYFADNFTSASTWASVLAKYPGLTLDLAHFGGSDIWNWMGSVKTFSGSFEDIENNFPTDPEKLPKEAEPAGEDDEKIVQLASLYHTWIKATADLCNTYVHVYTDLACFVLPDEYEKGGNNVPIMSLIAKNLAFLIGKYPELKYKILVASDWFMSENDGSVGVGTYFKRMFQLLKMVSEIVKFDAWHQFAVINPLKFMGLWVEGGKIDVEKCGRYVERLQMWVIDDNLKSLFKKKTPDFDYIKGSGDSFINYLRNIPEIKKSTEIKDENNDLLILGG